MFSLDNPVTFVVAFLFAVVIIASVIAIYGETTDNLLVQTIGQMIFIAAFVLFAAWILTVFAIAWMSTSP